MQECILNQIGGTPFGPHIVVQFAIGHEQQVVRQASRSFPTASREPSRAARSQSAVGWSLQISRGDKAGMACRFALVIRDGRQPTIVVP